jgi:uncharacterized damage-inducible protein DinB
MGLSKALLPEFDQEMANTRKTLERVPDLKLSWKPHEKSMTMGRLAQHLAELPGWVPLTLEKDSIDMAPGGKSYSTPEGKSQKDILALFDKNIEAARKIIDNASDEQLLKTWSLLMNEKTAFTLPRIAVLRSFVMNHLIHHRAQLGVYLRLNDIPVPGVYGPSADEK